MVLPEKKDGNCLKRNYFLSHDIFAEPVDMNDVLQKIERIRSVFLNTQVFYSKQDNMNALIGYLENTDIEFRSIAYESASMAIAVKDLQNNQELNTWLFYANVLARAHRAQVYVGLGWAIAKLNLPFLPVVEKIESCLYYRVADGCGFYDGSFRQRQTVLNQQLPAYLPGAAMPLYDQGIGRSFWYTCNGDMKEVCRKVNSFPAGRQASLWRGIGIAVAYVGASDENTLKTLLQLSSTKRLELACGAALAARSRLDANTMNVDTNRCSRLWYTLTAGKTKIFSSEPTDMKKEEDYFNWIKRAEERLADSFEKGIIDIL